MNFNNLTQRMKKTRANVTKSVQTAQNISASKKKVASPKIMSKKNKNQSASTTSTQPITTQSGLTIKTPTAFQTPNSKPSAKNIAAAQANEKDRNLVGDTLWLFVLVMAFYGLLSLFTFSMHDPSWSRSIPNMGQIDNVGGLLGAYASDIAYYVFGLSIWWTVVAVGVWLYRNFRPMIDKGVQPYNPWIAATGLGILLTCSPVLEFFVLGNYLDNRLPLGAGGWLGSTIASRSQQFLGSTGSALLLFIAAMLAFSLLIQISWLDFLERVGIQLERFFKRIFQDREKDNLPIFFPEKTTPRVVSEVEKIVAEPITQKPASSISNRKVTVTVAPPPASAVAPKKASGSLKKPTPQNGEYVLPDVSSLKTPQAQTINIDPDQLQETAERIEAKLAEFGIAVEVVSATAGPVITRFEIEPAKGVKGSQIVNLSKDLARSLSMQSVRVVETIAGKNTMGIELPNTHRQEVLLQEILTADVFTEATSKLTIALGKDIAGVPVVGDLAKMPHLLVGGMTGSGKSVGVNAMILSMLYKAKPDEVRFIMIDPKMLELSVYEGIPHLLCPVVTDMKAAGNALNWCVAEMEKRYRLLSYAGVRNLAGYNEKIQAAKNTKKPLFNPFSLNPDEPEPLETLPQIVIVIDELADLMMTEKKTVETQIARLAQKARAAGIHMIIATQRPSVDVITGLIKANVPTRMAFTVQSRIDSRTILDQMGAEDLLKYGDLLFLQPGNAEPTRLQGAFISDYEVHNVVSFIKEQGQPNYVEGILSGEATAETNHFIHPEANHNGDELFDQAAQFVISSRKTSISALQRHLRIGYNRAANLMQALEDGGIVSAATSDGKRQILATLPEN